MDEEVEAYDEEVEAYDEEVGPEGMLEDAEAVEINASEGLS